MSDDDASSSSSDDDYLTMNDSSRDRESLVRKKLLENFYGKSAVAAARPTNAKGGDDDEDDDNNHMDESFLSPHLADRDDLDSPSFDASHHTHRHVLDSGVHDLLEVEERLALQVRTLDSTMQTLVYENYSRFIDATDAIRSIGINVQANEAGLNRLSERIQSVDIASKDTEEALGTLRDQVAEKIRVKRLLSRLDALLKLPQTLRVQIASGKYRTATRSYISANSILGKHSAGFESLRNIETECTGILQEMKKLLVRKLMHWNGRLQEDLADDDKDNVEDCLPEPPKTMTEIFECVGTLHILMEDGVLGPKPGEDANEMVDATDRLDKDELQSLAVGAATRSLDRILDAHMIQVQERRFAPLGAGGGGSPPLSDLRASAALAAVGPPNAAVMDSSATAVSQPGAAFVPRDFLDAILEVATLFGMSFGNSSQVSLLSDFISEAFSSFLSHVRAVLLEESAQMKENEENHVDMTDMAGEDTSAEEEMSSALALLVQAVREMAQGLSLPEVGVNSDFTSGLVGEAMQLADSMVTVRVRQKFTDLRVGIVKECLLPFAENLVEQIALNDKSVLIDKDNIAKARLVASGTLSDCLQLVDDTIRSILAGTRVDETEVAKSSQNSNNLPGVVKESVQESTKAFTDWLAAAFEVLAGGEASGTNRLIETNPGVEGFDNDEDDDEVGKDPVGSSAFSTAERLSDIKQSENVMEQVESTRMVLLQGNDGLANELIVAIAEMCRLAQGSVSENLEQSMATHLGTNKRRSQRHMFSGDNPLRDASKAVDEEDEVSERFKLAASRVFALYAQQKGSETAALLASDVDGLSEENLVCNGPRQNVCSALGAVKSMALECSAIFDGPSRAGPVPVLDDDPIGGLTSSASPMSLGMKSTLQIDVERIFKEKVVVRLHPSEQLDFSQSALIFLMMKLAVRELMESVRLCFISVDGFVQLQVDVEFLKLMIPHYINEDFATNGNNACSTLSNLLTDVMSAAGERCIDETCENDEQLRQESVSLLRAFMSRAAEDTGMGSQFIISKE